MPFPPAERRPSAAGACPLGSWLLRAPRTTHPAQCCEKAGFGGCDPSPLLPLSFGLGTWGTAAPVALPLGGVRHHPGQGSSRSLSHLPFVTGSQLRILSPLQSREKVTHSGCVCKYCDSIFYCASFSKGGGYKVGSFCLCFRGVGEGAILSFLWIRKSSSRTWDNLCC